jgi:hypothetical protein
MILYKSEVPCNKWFRGYFQKGLKEVEYFFCFLGNSKDNETLIAMGTPLDVPVIEKSKSKFLFTVINQKQFEKFVDEQALVFAMNRDWTLAYEPYKVQVELTNAFNFMIFQIPTSVKCLEKSTYNDEKSKMNFLNAKLL